MTPSTTAKETETRRDWWLAVAALVASAACWGLATVMTKGALSALPPFTLLTIQLGASIAFLWTAVAVTRQYLPRNAGTGPAAACGLLEPGLAYGVGVPGLMLTSAANASVVGATEPALICLLAWLLQGERPERRVMLSIVCAMVGVALVTLSGEGFGRSHLAGDLLVLAGTLFATLYVIASSRFVTVIAPLPLAALQQSAGFGFAWVLLAIAWASGLERLPESVSAEALLLAVISGIVQYALPFWLYLIGLKVVPTSMAALFLALIPVFGVGGAVLFLGETVSPAQGLGCVVVVAAVAAIAHRSG